MAAERPAPPGERTDGDPPGGDEAAPEVVDFDALNAALGELPPPPTSSSPMIPESQGRKNATYSSTRPHPVPATRGPATDQNAPAVIVAQDDTVPSGPPLQMTVPLNFVNRPGPSKPPPLPPGARTAPMLPSQPPPYATAPVANAANAANARYPRVRMQTIVMRDRGPSRQQKLLVFMAMLLVFVSGGVGFLIYGKQLGLGIDLDVRGASPRSTTAAPVTTTITPEPAASSAPGAAIVVGASVSATASASPVVAPSASSAPVSTASVKRVARPRDPAPASDKTTH